MRKDLLKQIYFVTVLSLPFLNGCGSPRVPPPPSRDQLEGQKELIGPRDAFSIDLPKDCKMTARNTKMDFEVFDVMCRGKDMVGIYTGNAPDISTGQKLEKVILKPDLPQREMILQSKDAEQTPRGYLWQTEYDWPSNVHVWITPGQSYNSQAQTIAASVRPIRPNISSTSPAS